MNAATSNKAATETSHPETAHHETTNPSAAHPAIRILKIATCPSMSGKSKLTYHIGGSAKSEILTGPQLYFRVYANTAAGFFSKEWVALSAIQQLFGKAPQPDAITSFILHPLFKGKSINTPAFLFAALMSEGLVKASTTKRRCYECTDGKKFFAEVKALVASDVDLTDKLQKIEDKQVKSKPAQETEQPVIAGTKKAVGKEGTAKPTELEVSILPSQKKASKKVSAKAA